MNRKFRPEQCPQCKWYRLKDAMSNPNANYTHCLGGGDYPELIGESSRKCPDFEAKEVK